MTTRRSLSSLAALALRPQPTLAAWALALALPCGFGLGGLSLPCGFGLVTFAASAHRLDGLSLAALALLALGKECPWPHCAAMCLPWPFLAALALRHLRPQPITLTALASRLWPCWPWARSALGHLDRPCVCLGLPFRLWPPAALACPCGFGLGGLSLPCGFGLVALAYPCSFGLDGLSNQTMRQRLF